MGFETRVFGVLTNQDQRNVWVIKEHAGHECFTNHPDGSILAFHYMKDTKTDGPPY